MKKYLALLLAMLMCFSMLSACAKDGDDDSNDPMEGAQAGATGGGQTIDIVKADKYKENIIIGVSGSMTTVDPHAVSNIVHNGLFIVCFDRLIKWNSTSQSFEPELATAWSWTDDVTLNLKLRNDVKFHNGEPFTADDVKFSIQHAVESGTTVATKAKAIKEVQIVNDYEVNIVLEGVDVDFLNTLSLPMMSIVNREACEKDPMTGGFIGTGAWIYDSMVEGDEVKFKVNSNYWGEVPKSKTMTFKNIPESSTRLIALQNNEIDVCLDPNTTELDIIKADEKLNLIEFAGTACTYFAFNTQKAPGNDQNFRLALAHAIDIEELALVYCDGQAKLASVFWGWTTYGYDESIERYEYNLDKAKEYLAKTEHRTLELTCTSGYKTIVETIQAQLKDIGVTVNVNEVQGAAQTAMTKYASATHEAMVYGLSWNDMGDDARRPYYKDSNTNKAIIHDQEIFDWIDAAKKEFDDTKRKEMYSNVQQKNHDQCYFLPLFYANKYVVLNDNGGGVRLEPNSYHDWTYFCVAEK